VQPTKGLLRGVLPGLGWPKGLLPGCVLPDLVWPKGLLLGLVGLVVSGGVGWLWLVLRALSASIRPSRAA